MKTRMTVAALLASSFIAALASTNGASAAPDAVFVTLKDQGFTPVVSAEGATARFANLDSTVHQITSRDTTDQGEPIFYSDVLGTGQVGTVYGVEDLPARAEPYGFYCPFHAWMTGALVVTGSAPR